MFKVLAIALGAGLAHAGAVTPVNFADDSLVAWCIVPFDAKKRSPEARAKMLLALGLRRCAYDWRAEHVASFEAEIEAYRKFGIEFTAFWGEHESAFELFIKHRISPQIWKTCPSPSGKTQQERVAAAAAQLQGLAVRCRRMGSKLGLYNHGGWGGVPENLIAVCRALIARGHDNVGVVYNFHHAHGRIADFAADLKLLKPHLLCLNLNGMNPRAEPKILPIGQGLHEAAMIRTVIASGYSGPIGILDHLPDEDSAVALKGNLDGLRRLLAEGGNPGTQE